MTNVTSPGEALRPAGDADLGEIEALLRESALPVDGVRDSIDTFVLAESDGRVQGVIGLEVHDRYGLLRSAVVRPDARGTGLGGQLVQRILADAKARGLETVYLLTTTAERYFPRFGFAVCTRADVPDAVKRSVEFRGACPDSAVVMRRAL